MTALRLNAYALLGTEVAVTGLLVFALSHGSVEWALVRLGETALAAGLGHARAACRAAWHATRRSVNLDLPSGDWDGLLAVIEPAIARFEQYVLVGSSSSFEAAQIAVRYAMAKHAEVVSTTRAATKPWDMDRSSVLAEIEQVLDDLRRALRDQPPRES